MGSGEWEGVMGKRGRGEGESRVRDREREMGKGRGKGRGGPREEYEERRRT
jgi:hypothetical protein